MQWSSFQPIHQQVPRLELPLSRSSFRSQYHRTRPNIISGVRHVSVAANRVAPSYVSLSVHARARQAALGRAAGVEEKAAALRNKELMDLQNKRGAVKEMKPLVQVPDRGVLERMRQHRLQAAIQRIAKETGIEVPEKRDTVTILKARRGLTINKLRSALLQRRAMPKTGTSPYFPPFVAPATKEIVHEPAIVEVRIEEETLPSETTSLVATNEVVREPAVVEIEVEEEPIPSEACSSDVNTDRVEINAPILSQEPGNTAQHDSYSNQADHVAFEVRHEGLSGDVTPAEGSQSLSADDEQKDHPTKKGFQPSPRVRRGLRVQLREAKQRNRSLRRRILKLEPLEARLEAPRQEQQLLTSAVPPSPTAEELQSMSIGNKQTDPTPKEPGSFRSSIKEPWTMSGGIAVAEWETMLLEQRLRDLERLRVAEIAEAERKITLLQQRIRELEGLGVPWRGQQLLTSVTLPSTTAAFPAGIPRFAAINDFDDDASIVVHRGSPVSREETGTITKPTSYRRFEIEPQQTNRIRTTSEAGIAAPVPSSYQESHEETSEDLDEKIDEELVEIRRAVARRRTSFISDLEARAIPATREGREAYLEKHLYPKGRFVIPELGNTVGKQTSDFLVHFDPRMQKIINQGMDLCSALMNIKSELFAINLHLLRRPRDFAANLDQLNYNYYMVSNALHRLRILARQALIYKIVYGKARSFTRFHDRLISGRLLEYRDQMHHALTAYKPDARLPEKWRARTAKISAQLQAMDKGLFPLVFLVTARPSYEGGGLAWYSYTRHLNDPNNPLALVEKYHYMRTYKLIYFRIWRLFAMWGALTALRIASGQVNARYGRLSAKERVETGRSWKRQEVRLMHMHLTKIAESAMEVSRLLHDYEVLAFERAKMEFAAGTIDEETLDRDVMRVVDKDTTFLHMSFNKHLERDEN